MSRASQRASNPIWGETASYGFQVLNQNNSDVRRLRLRLRSRASRGTPTDGGNTDFRAPYVGYNPNAALFKTVGNSAYDALETHMEKRLSHNFQAGASYTWSHALDEQSDIGLFFTGDNPNKLRDSWASADFDRTHVFTANFQVAVPDTAKPHSLLSYFANDWHLTGMVVAQSGEPYSLYEFYGASAALYFGNYPTLMNPVLAIKNPAQPQGRPHRQQRDHSAARAAATFPPSIPRRSPSTTCRPARRAFPSRRAAIPQDIYETDFAPRPAQHLPPGLAEAAGHLGPQELPDHREADACSTSSTSST